LNAAAPTDLPDLPVEPQADAGAFAAAPHAIRSIRGRPERSRPPLSGMPPAAGRIALA